MSRYDNNDYSSNDVNNLRKRKGRVDNTTKRKVKTQFLIALFFALLASIGYIYVSTDSGSLTYVIKAKESVSVGQIITENNFNNFVVVALPESVIEPDTFRDDDPQKLIDLLYNSILNESTLYPIAKNQQIRPQFFTGSGSGLPNRNIAPDERQIAISLSASRAVAGTIKAGDYVDVYVVSEGISGLLAQNIKVLSVSLPQGSLESAAAAQLQSKDSDLSDYLPTEPIGGTYILLVKSEDVSKFFAAENGGIIYFAMRNENSLPVVTEPVNAKDAICRNNNSQACRG
jgi:Flp pilus assembly protein CpaB